MSSIYSFYSLVSSTDDLRSAAFAYASSLVDIITCPEFHVFGRLTSGCCFSVQHNPSGSSLTRHNSVSIDVPDRIRVCGCTSRPGPGRRWRGRGRSCRRWTGRPIGMPAARPVLASTTRTCRYIVLIGKRRAPSVHFLLLDHGEQIKF